MYEKGEGVIKSQERAAYHFMFAADRYDPEAQLKVALIFEEGNGPQVHLNRAVMYFKLSARGGNKKEHLKVEKYLELSHGVERPKKSSDENNKSLNRNISAHEIYYRVVRDRMKRITSSRNSI